MKLTKEFNSGECSQPERKQRRYDGHKDCRDRCGRAGTQQREVCIHRWETVGGKVMYPDSNMIFPRFSLLDGSLSIPLTKQLVRPFGMLSPI